MIKGILSLSLAALFALALSSRADADFYQYVDDDGVMHITNVPTSTKFKWLMGERKRIHVKFTEQDGKMVIAKDYDALIKSTSIRYGVPASLVKAIVKAESDFDRMAVSVKGARGLMQLMPETAKTVGVSDIDDPEDNVEGGIKYLSKLLKMFNGNVPLAVAAYNAGENAVIKYGSIPPYAETRNYVKKVLYFYKIYSAVS